MMETITVQQVKEQKARLQAILDSAKPFPSWSVDTVKVQFVKEERRNSWNQHAKGLVVRIAQRGNYNSFQVERYYTELLESNGLVIRSTRRSEKLRKGSGYMGVRNVRVYASVERETISLYVSFKDVKS